MKLVVSSDGTLRCGNAIYRCALGKGGIGNKDGEGDGITPVGTYALRQIFYRVDCLEKPRTKLPTSVIHKEDGWCDEPNDASYNQLIKKPFSSSHEDMWRGDELYDLVVVIGYNDDPIVSGKGSAIFIHVAKPDYQPTEGCIALKREDLLKVIADCGPETEIEIG